MYFEKFTYAGPGRAEEAFIFLHGFPGRFSKNEDLAVHLVASLKVDCYLPHYSGISSSPGEFLFTRSIEETKAFIETLLSSGEYQRINLIAHSWGAFVAIALLESSVLKLHKIVLLAPLTFVPPLESLEGDLRTFIETQVAIGRPASLKTLLEDLKKLRDLARTTVEEPQFSNWPETLVVQGNADDVTPAALNRKYFAGAAENVRFIEVTDSHWLTNRSSLSAHVTTFLRVLL